MTAVAAALYLSWIVGYAAAVRASGGTWADVTPEALWPALTAADRKQMAFGTFVKLVSLVKSMAGATGGGDDGTRDRV
jgi:hypothetical protein